ncbi:restriction endonuclease subunit S [Acetoanaerobium noterae]|uniref:restriction endonuclease subunit S n=1 Tax=Acetoanaerobium noterae TaxID=745369 RepID=UPI0032420223
MGEWEVKRLSSVCKVISGYAFKSEEFQESGVPVIKISNIGNGFCDLQNNLQYIDKAFLNDLDEKYILQKDSILISLTGSHITQPNSMVGRSCRYTGDTPLLLNQRAGRIIPKQNTKQGIFLYYVMQSQLVKEYIGIVAYGAANQANISPKTIEGIKIRMPDFSTQIRIADILSTYDDLIENNNRRIELLEKAAQELYKEWFVRFRFPNHENTKFVNGLPEGWEVRRVKEYGRVETGKTPPTSDPDNYSNEIMFVKTPDMHGNSFVIETDEWLSFKGHKTQPKKLLPENSIMVSCIGTGGVVAINASKAHTNQQINSIIPDDAKYLEWLYFTCKSLKETIELFGATGATMTNLSKGKFEKLKVINPSKGLVYSFSEKINPIFIEIKNLMKQNQNLKKQRDLLLPRLMSGRLEV